MHPSIPCRTGLFAALFFSSIFQGCGKKNQDPSAKNSKESSLSAGEEEAAHNQAAIHSVEAQEKEFLLGLEATKAGVAKLGNKTRKKLKPDLALLDGKSVRLDSLIRKLPSLDGPDIKPSVAIISATLDSANAELAHVRKFLK